MKEMNFINISVIAFLMCSLSSFGHQDDRGDVHPLVRVEENRFVVYFKNNIEEKTYKTVLAQDTSIVSERKESPTAPKIIPPIDLPEILQGINVKTDDAFYVFPEWQRKHKGEPFVLKITDGKKDKISLDWGIQKIDMVHGAMISEKKIIMTTTVDPKKNFSNAPFSFNSFDLKTRKKLHSTEIGMPVRVYFFPRASNVITHEGYAYVAWMFWDGKKIDLKLSQFDSHTGVIETRNVSVGWGNTSPSIGVIGDSLLIAFHSGRKINFRTERHEAMIVYKSVKISKLFKKTKK